MKLYEVFIAAAVFAAGLFWMHSASAQSAAAGSQSGSASQSSSGAGAAASINIGTGGGAGVSGAGVSGAGVSGQGAGVTGSGGGSGLISGGGAATSYGAQQGQGQSLTYSPQSNVEAVDLGDSVPHMWSPGLGGGGSNPCVVSISGAGAGSGFGFSFGRAHNDEECQIREALRVMGGQLASTPEAQVFQKNIACQSDIYRKALEQASRESGRSNMKCADAFYPDGERRAARRASTQPVSTTTYATEVAKCRNVSDTAYAGCMRAARQYL